MREIEPEDVVAVAHDLRDDLAEAERDDREVVAAQAQRRQADQNSDQSREAAGDQEDEPEREVDPRQLPRDPDGAEVERPLVELLRGQPGGGVGAGRVKGNVAEVEQARVADDDVEADGHHRHDHHDHHRIERRDEVPEQRQVAEALDVLRIEERGQDQRDRDE